MPCDRLRGVRAGLASLARCGWAATTVCCQVQACQPLSSCQELPAERFLPVFVSEKKKKKKKKKVPQSSASCHFLALSVAYPMPSKKNKTSLSIPSCRWASFLSPSLSILHNVLADFLSCQLKPHACRAFLQSLISRMQMGVRIQSIRKKYEDGSIHRLIRVAVAASPPSTRPIRLSTLSDIW